MTWVILTLRFQWNPKLATFIYRWMTILRPWAMLEIFMLGMLVAVVKLGDIAILIIGPAFWSFSLLIAVMAATAIIPDNFTVWNRLRVCNAQH
jgi:Uncharacterized paraquat-inducible protein A